MNGYDWFNNSILRQRLTREQWDLFKSLLPVNTIVISWDGPVFDIDEETGEEFGVFGGGRKGIFLGFKANDEETISFMYEDDSPIDAPECMLIQPFDFDDTCWFYEPRDLEYEINGETATFEDIITGRKLLTGGQS